MLKIKKSLLDISCMFYIIATLAFHDKKIIFISCQFFFLLMTILNMISKKNTKVHIVKIQYYVWYVSFFLFSVLSGTWSKNTTTYVTILTSIIQVALMGICIINYMKTQDKIDSVLFLVIISSLLICLRLATAVPLSAWGSARVGTYIGYGNVGVTYLLGYSSVLTFYIGKKNKNIFLILLSLLFIFISSMTGTKKGILAFAVGIFVILIFEAKNPKIFLKNILTFVFICVICYYAVFYIKPLYNAVGIRVESAVGQIKGNILDKSTRDRMLLITYALKDFKEHPIIGIGIDAFRFSANNPLQLYAHNNYLELLADLGVIGAFLYYLIPLLTLIRLIVNKNKKYCLMSLSLLIALFVGDFSSVSYFQETLQIFMSIILGVALFCESQTKDSLKEHIIKR